MSTGDFAAVTARVFDRTTILVVDDDEVSLTVIAELFSPGYRVLRARSGQQALDTAAGEPRPSLILLDIMMPDMDGYTVLARLKADPATRDIPVIFVTALNASEDEERGLSLGAVDYITKPLHPAIIRARVRTHLELKRAQDRLRDQAVFLEAEVTRRMDENRQMERQLQQAERLAAGPAAPRSNRDKTGEEG